MKPIKNIIFDFGDVFINLDKSATQIHLEKFGISEFDHEAIATNKRYEKGLMSSDAFVAFYTNKFDGLSRAYFIQAWNSILKDLPKQRLQFLKKLQVQNKYKLYLLSNTNELHINWVKKNIDSYDTFNSYFKGFYLSHEINLRKPDASIFEFVLQKNSLHPDETLFIDDTKAHIESAKSLNLQTWHLNPEIHDVSQLFEQKHLNL